MISNIQRVIDDYLENINVRSEEEVRSKLIVPLIEALGYDSNLRGEAFPVYSSHGRKKNSTTSADFVLFDDPEFNNHTKYTDKDIKWVQDHSLLVIEAKKPEEFPDVQGQAQFYTMWLRSLAYIVSDGKRLKAWLFNGTCSDELIIDVEICDKSDFSQLLRFDYSSLRDRKIESREHDDYSIITDASELNLPSAQLEYMRATIGKNAEGLDNLGILSKYLHTCDFILQNDIRYGIHPNALDLLRAVYNAKLFIDENEKPSFKGDLYYSYWDDYDLYQFDCEIFRLVIGYYKKSLACFSINHISSSNSIVVVEDEIERFLKLFIAKKFRISFDEKQLVVSYDLSKDSLKAQKMNVSFYSDLLSKLRQLKDIEQKYNLMFDFNKDDVTIDLFHNIDAVYNGVNMIENCTLTINCKGMKSFEILTPTVMSEGDITNISDKDIFGFIFHPIRTYALPGKYKVSILKKHLDLSICCEYGLFGEG